MDSIEEKNLGYLPIEIYKTFMNMNPALVQKTSSQNNIQKGNNNLTLNPIMALLSAFPWKSTM